MNEDKKKMTKEGKLEKAKKLMAELKNLELTSEELDNIAGGVGNLVGNDARSCRTCAYQYD